MMVTGHTRAPDDLQLEKKPKVSLDKSLGAVMWRRQEMSCLLHIIEPQILRRPGSRLFKQRLKAIMPTLRKASILLTTCRLWENLKV
jgi:hypothetical protein